jgi:hypothetical protein
MFATACDYLPIPGAEVDVKRRFNIARDILGLRRTLVMAETMRALVLVKNYIRHEAAGQV